MTVTEPRRMGRPPKTSREQILDAAALSDPQHLQLTVLAQQLGIAVKTVYYYFPTRKILLEALTERSVQQLGLPDLDKARDWRAVLTEAARWAYELGYNKPGYYAQSPGAIGSGSSLSASSLLSSPIWAGTRPLRCRLTW